MQERHKNRKQYFDEQSITTAKYVIPYIEKHFQITPATKVLEIGCGEGGNLMPFLERDCEVVGVDILPQKIENAKAYYENHPKKEKINFLVKDIYQVKGNEDFSFDVIIMRDTIEHIPNQEVFLSHVKPLMKPGAVIFFAFPPWRMPFGGHQQICNNKLLSLTPYFHILPEKIYRVILSLFGESAQTIEELIEIKDTRISIQRFHKILQKNNFHILEKTYYLINPNYEVKFRLTPRELPGFLSISQIRDFYTTAMYCLAKT